MSCAYPQWRIPEEALTSNGWVHHYLYEKYRKRIHNKGVIIQRPEFESLSKEYPFLTGQIDQIPCGKCIQCRLSYSREWANRCMLELKTCENAYFLTLTYDNEHLQFAPYVDPDSGECYTRPVLNPKQLQKFMKRLRFWCSERTELKQKFYACGEYGETTQRPHYHLIVYNLPKEFEAGNHIYDQSVAGVPLWTSSALSKLWPYGIAVYGQVTWSTCAYTARYCMKKLKGKSRMLQQEMQEKLFPGQPWVEEFVRMSLRPAIGKQYFDDHLEEIYLTDEVFVNVKDEIQAVKPSKYYDKLYDVLYPEDLKKIKQKRKHIAKLQHDDIMSRTDLSEEAYLLMKEESKKDQAKKLVRPTI